MKKRIVFITDCCDVAYSELRATVLSELEKLNIDSAIEIEPVVAVKPFSIINGSFLLRLLADSYPAGTIFSIILNPAKDRPERILGRTKKNNFYFIGANTGVFNWFIKDFGVAELYELNDPGFLPFGGKYVHAPAVAKIASGIDLKDLGKNFSVDKLRMLDLAEGTIVHIDNFGLIKFIGPLPNLSDGQEVTIRIKEQEIKAIYTTRMMNKETGTWTIYPGSSFGLPEIGKVRQDGAKELKVEVGDKVEIVF